MNKQSPIILFVKENVFLAMSFAVVIGVSVLSLNNGFFWDTVQLGSRHANFYFENGFSKLLLPNEIDSGHIPSFGLMLSLLWKIFGRSLIVGHLFILPFAIGIVWQFYLLAKKVSNKEVAGLVSLMLIIDPVLLSQISLVSPDVLLVFFFLLGLNSVFKNKRKLLALSIFGLFLVSMRGMMVALSILFLDLIINVDFKTVYKKLFKLLLKRSIIYLPALLIFIVFSVYHYVVKGWIGYHEDSTWAACFEKVDFNGFLLNIRNVFWYLFDNGRIGLGFIGFLLLIIYYRKIFKNELSKKLIYFFMVIFIILTANMVWAKMLISPRYLMPVNIVMSLVAVNILFSDYVNKYLRNTILVFWFAVLLTGNLWVYPERISQAWDCTLAHMPYSNLRNQANAYLDEQKIDYNEVVSFFPNLASNDDINLNGDKRKFVEFDEAKKSKYIYYSNVYNVHGNTLMFIEEHYIPIKTFKNKTVYIVIYKLK